MRVSTDYKDQCRRTLRSLYSNEKLPFVLRPHVAALCELVDWEPGDEREVVEAARAGVADDDWNALVKLLERKKKSVLRLIK